MSLQTRWQQEPAPVEAGAMVLVVSKAAVDVLRSTTASQKLPNLLWRKQMPHKVIPLMETMQHQLPPPRVQFQRVRTAVLLSPHFGDETMPVT
jgi:hypothetical protein